VNVSFEDLADIALPALRHRCLLNFQAEAEGVSADQIITMTLKKVAKK
jgi:MoxR-like ATPase